MDEKARFPEVAQKAGHYESFYLKAAQPGGGRALWIRHTVHKRPGQEANASIWFVLFDRAADEPRATKLTVAGGGALGAERALDPGRRCGDRPGQRRRLDRDRRAEGLLGPHLLGRRGALQVPAGRLALRGPGAENEVRRALPVRDLQGQARARRRDDRARRLAGDGRPQLGDRARRALGLARGHRLRGRARRLLRRRRGADQGRAMDQPVDPVRDARRSTARPTGSGASARSARRRSRTRRPIAASSSRARTSSSAAASQLPGRTSSAGSTPTPTVPSTTPSTARSPTSS